MWGPWGQAFPLIARLPPACSLGSPLSTFQTSLIITPLGPACSRHLRSLAGRFVSLLPSLLSSPSAPSHGCAPPTSPTIPHPDPPQPSLPHSAFLPIEPLSLRKFPPGRTKKQQADLREKFPHGAEMGEAPCNAPSLSPGRRWRPTGPCAVLRCWGPCGVSVLQGLGATALPGRVPQTFPSSPLLGHGDRTIMQTGGWLTMLDLKSKCRLYFLVSFVYSQNVFALIQKQSFKMSS